MAKTNPHTRKSEQVQIARISAVQAIIVALIAAVATAVPVYFAGKQQGKETAIIEPTPTPEGQPPNQSVRLINKPDLENSIEKAQRRVFATGYVLDPIDPKRLADKIKQKADFQVKLVLVDPTSNVVCQRDTDEGSKTPGYEKLTEKIKRINRYREDLPEEAYKVKLSAHYPTMAVYIIDDDVYAYLYPYAASGSDSPVLWLSEKDETAKFFINHFRSIFEASQLLPKRIKYKGEEPCKVRKP